jgi:hypothetical protein
LTILQGVERAATDSSADPALTLIDHDPSTNGHAEQRATGMSGARPLHTTPVSDSRQRVGRSGSGDLRALRGDGDKPGGVGLITVA